MDEHYKTKTLPPGGSLDSKLPFTSYGMDNYANNITSLVLELSIRSLHKP
jgi:hypothetical protein